jgi:2-polyprenyl-3-methyl-5-hydroxy-6-metoxy-1,4-benzoquinol methylase
MKKIKEVLRLYPKLSIISRIFCYLRWQIAPFKDIIDLLPPKGNILDVGCGYGLLSNLIALEKPKCQIHGIDIDEKRIDIAKETSAERNNIHFQMMDIAKSKLPKSRYDVIIFFDVFHHVSFKAQEELLKQCVSLLSNKGKIIVKEIDKNPKYKYYWNMLHDKLVTLFSKLYFRSEHEWTDLFNEYEYTTISRQKSNKGILYPHVIFVLEKK